MDENYEFFEEEKANALLFPENENLASKRSYKLKNNYKADTQLTDQNIILEREFRNEVVEWLINGEPKLFRSPTEGNIVVRLMNVSLTPNDTLGRMIYTFNCTAYEVDKNDLKTLIKKGFLEKQQFEDVANDI